MDTIYIVEMKDGSTVFRVSDGNLYEDVQRILRECWSRQAAKVYAVPDGYDWDPESEPVWTDGATIRYRIYGPRGSGVIELPWTADGFWELLAEHYPKTYALMDNCSGMEVTNDGPALADDEAAALYAKEEEQR